MKLLTVAIAFVLFVLFASVALAQDDPISSGWPHCDLHTVGYDHTNCIASAEQWKGSQAPYEQPSTPAEAIADYEWSVHAPRPLSPCSAVGVGGPLLPMDYQTRCEDIPDPEPTEPPLSLSYVSWLPIVGACRWQAPEGYSDCGN